MRCYNCGKNFDYDKYYGICPKCGSFNKKETAEESHQAYHDQYDGGYRHLETKRETEREVQTEGSSKIKRGGGKFFAAGLLVFLLSLLMTVLTPLLTRTLDRQRQRKVLAMEIELPLTEYGMDEEFQYKETILRVKECRVLDNPEVLADLAEGKKLVAVRLIGSSDGEYEPYNRLEEPYLAAGGTYRRPISSYVFKPYSRIFGIDLIESSSLQMNEVMEGWYVFQVEAEDEEGQICFETHEKEYGEGALMHVDAVNVSFESRAEGGVDHEE